jgi:pyruvate carboxylase subunit B
MRYRVMIAGRTVEVDLGPHGVQVDGERVSAELQAVPDGPVRSLLLDGASHRFVARRSEPGLWELQLRGWRLAAEVVDQRTLRIREMTGAASAAAGPKPVRAPMPGLVVRVEVADGDVVKPGQGLVIVEAMKMENELRAEIAGRVKAVRVQAGQAVEKDQVLIELGPPGG